MSQQVARDNMEAIIAEAQAQALEEAADDLDGSGPINPRRTDEWLRARAEWIRKETR